MEALTDATTHTWSENRQWAGGVWWWETADGVGKRTTGFSLQRNDNMVSTGARMKWQNNKLEQLIMSEWLNKTEIITKVSEITEKATE